MRPVWTLVCQQSYLHETKEELRKVNGFLFRTHLGCHRVKLFDNRRFLVLSVDGASFAQLLERAEREVPHEEELLLGNSLRADGEGF